MHSQFHTFIKEKFMRNLDKNTCAVASVGFTSTSSPMFHIFQNGQCIRNMLMRFIPPDIGNKTDTTGIMFKLRIVQTWILFHNNWFYATDNRYFHRFYKPFISIRLPVYRTDCSISLYNQVSPD